MGGCEGRRRRGGVGGGLVLWVRKPSGCAQGRTGSQKPRQIAQGSLCPHPTAQA